VSSLLPEEFTEYVVRVYYTKNSDEEEKDAKECFDWWCRGMCEIELEFKGTKRVITGDCPSLEDCGITEIRSCKVIRGVWELCEGRDYTDPYVQLNRGECLTWGTENCTTSVLSIKHVTSFNIRLYQEENFEGPVCVTTVECPSVEKQFNIKAIHSCKVISGVWKLYNDPNYSGEHYLLKEGEYRSLRAPAQSLECVPFKILLYEKVNFEGPVFETTVDWRSLHGCGINEVRSCKVLSGVWDLYADSDYTEPRYQLQEGKYPNPEAWSNGKSTAPALSVERVTPYRIRLYEKENFEGPVCVTTVECPSLDDCGITEIRSCKVISGVWKLYNDPNYSGEHYLLKEGEYRSLRAPAQSLECVPFKILLYEKVNFEGPVFETTVDWRSLHGCGINEVRSCKVLSGVWDLYEGSDYTEPRWKLPVGEYCNPEAWSASDRTAPAHSVKRVTE
ncbi:hypothetical protein M9458_052838, partial [Cirrhinus mrigala]